MSEGNGQVHIEAIHRVRIRDLTAELKRKDTTQAILYSRHVFPDAYDMVSMYLQRRTMVQMIKTELRKRGLIIDIVPEDDSESDDDDDDDDDEEKNSHLRPTGCSGVSPPYSLFDITHYMQQKKPPLNLLFDNEIFDHSYDEVIENSVMNRNKDKSNINNNDNNNNDNSNDNGSNHDDDHDTIVFRVNLSDDEEPEPESN